MERTGVIVGVAVLAAILAATGYFAFTNPVADRRELFNQDLAKIKPTEVKYDDKVGDFDRWQESIAAKPNLWERLVEPPPPPPKAPEPPPNLNKMLQDAGVAIGRAKVGDKVQIQTKGDQRGKFMAVGDSIAGLTIKEVTKDKVVFSLQWKGQELTTDLSRK